MTKKKEPGAPPKPTQATISKRGGNVMTVTRKVGNKSETFTGSVQALRAAGVLKSIGKLGDNS